MLVNVARILAKIAGRRLPPTLTKNFGERSLALLPPSLASALRLWGRKLAARGGPNANKRAIVALPAG